MTRSVEKVRATPNLVGHRIDLSWQNPSASDFSAAAGLVGIRIVRRTRTFPLTISDGTVVYPHNYDPLGAQFGPLVSHFSDKPPETLQNFYYTIFTADGTGQFYADDNSRAYALAADDFVIDGENLVERLYKMLPAVHQSHDRLSAGELSALPPQALTALNQLPRALKNRGPLRRFLHATGSTLNVMRSLAEALPALHNADLTPADFLMPLADWVGWELDRTLPVYAQRNEIKFAPHLYKSVGSIPNLRNIVNRYTGWYSQVAEFVQHIASSNAPPQFNLFAIAETSGGAWIGMDDAAAVLGLTTPESGVSGTVTAAANLIGTRNQPFSLRPGMEIAITADRRIPVRARFEAGDFQNIYAATAAEVCAVINRTMSEISAVPVGARIQITSNTVGENSSLRVENYLSSLVSLESAPLGRLSIFNDETAFTPPRFRLFYEVNDPLVYANEQTARQTLSGEKFVRGFLADRMPDAVQNPSDENAANDWQAAAPKNKIRYKTFRQGHWGSSHGLPAGFEGAQSSPASNFITQADGSRRVFLAWIEKSVSRTGSTAASALGFGTGNDQALGAIVGNSLTPAVLTSTNEPFNLTDGMELNLTVNGRKNVSVIFRANDLPNSGLATASAQEVVERINLSLADEAVAAVTSLGNFTITAADDRKSSLKVENDKLCFALGAPQTPQPARLFGQRGAPFEITPGSRLILRGNFSDIQAIQFAAVDFANPQQATAAEVVNLLNARLTRVVASVQTNGTIRLETLQTGGNEWLEIDFRQSTAASALGFDSGNQKAAGDWGDALIWEAKQTVTSAPTGNFGELCSVVAADGVVWLFWSRHLNGLWQIESSRWNGVNWSAPETLAVGGNGNVEPCAVLDNTARIWLFWSQKSGTDVWTLRRRVFDPAVSSWGAETVVTTLPLALATVADREPQAVRLTNGDLRIIFSSNREGGRNLFSVVLQPGTGTVSGLMPITAGGVADCFPAPLLLNPNRLHVFFRSDRSVALSQTATGQIPETDNRLNAAQPLAGFSETASAAAQMVDTGTIRRFAQTSTVTLRNAARNSRMRLWDDLLAYTPQRPEDFLSDPLLGQTDFYTRGTIGLYLSQTIPDSPLSQQKVKRLLPALQRFLPINVRVVVILAPRVDIEFVYGAGREIAESYQDRYPFIEFYSGLAEEAYRAVLPNVFIIRSNTTGDVSAAEADLTTLRRRTYFPPPE